MEKESLVSPETRILGCALTANLEVLQSLKPPACGLTKGRELWVDRGSGSCVARMERLLAEIPICLPRVEPTGSHRGVLRYALASLGYSARRDKILIR